MHIYDPEQAPKPATWLAADEHERIEAVLRWHRKAKVELDNEQLHAVMHVIVENQLAENLQSVVRAMPRLMKQGLSRHDAVHAVASVLARYMFDLFANQEEPTDLSARHARYDVEVDRLTADAWRCTAE